MPVGVVLIVRGASKLEAFDGGLTALGEWDHMVELEEPALGASALCADERALAAVARPDRPPDRGRNVARAARRIAGRLRSTAWRFLHDVKGLRVTTIVVRESRGPGRGELQPCAIRDGHEKRVFTGLLRGLRDLRGFVMYVRGG